MTYERMKVILDNYNWDDGFEIPRLILKANNFANLRGWFYFLSFLFTIQLNDKHCSL